MPATPGENGISVAAEVVSRLDASLGLLKARGPLIAREFYRALFAEQPALRKMFPKDTRLLEQKLVDSLVAVVALLKDPAAARSTLREMSVRHREYGAKREHYPIVCRLLLAKMAEEFADAWTDQLALEWKQALELVSQYMINADKA